MKKLLILTALFYCPLLSYGQTDGFMKLYEKYSGREGYTTVEMAGEMFRAINAADGTDSGAPGLNNVNRMIIIVAENGNKAFAEEVKEALQSGEYTTVSAVHDGSQSVEFFIRQEEGHTTEVVMNVYDGTEHIVMLLDGYDLNISQISRITGPGISIP